MPKKKKTQRNGFYFFMQDIMQDLKKEGRVFPNGMQDVVHVAHPRWKLLPPDERERYDRFAKEMKQKSTGKRSDSERQDNVGNVISERLNPETEMAKRRLKENKITKSRWPPGNEILDEKFYFISFEYMIQTEEGEFRPMEVGLVEFSLKAGITKTYHTFIDPGGIPLGYRFQAQSHSDDTHRIPIKDFELAQQNYRHIWIQLENFVNPSGEKREYPAMFAQNSDLICVERCLDWIHAHAALGYVNRLSQVFELENMVVSLYAQGGAQISVSGAMELLSTSAFDYEPNTRCKWHEEHEVKHCALGTVKRFAYALADSLADIYDFELQANSHLPEQPDGPTSYQVLPPDTLRMDYKPIPNRTSGYGPATGAVQWSRSYSSSTDNGVFGARDIRYMKSEPEDLDDPQDSEETFDPQTYPETVRRPNIPGYAASVAPWVSAIGRGKPAVQPNEADWPSLGGDPMKGKYAGRSAPPSASIPQPPSSWQSAAFNDVQKQQAYGGQPYVEHIVNEPAAAKRTIHQAVQAKSMQPATTSLPEHPTSSASDTAQKQLDRPVNAHNRSARARGGARGRNAARAPGYQPPPADAAVSVNSSGSEFGDSMPDQPSTYSASSQEPQSKPAPIVTGDQDSWPTLGAAAGSRPAFGGIGRGRGISTTPAWQVPSQGLGRGRGIWNPAVRSASANFPGNKASQPPPGFGRGLASQMASLNLGNTGSGSN